MKKLVVFTGGGSGGHVVPAITLIKELQSQDTCSIAYIGGRSGIESEIVPALGVLYSGISTGKLRRYLSIENFIDIFKVFLGFMQSLGILLKYRLKHQLLIFSTGGFVAVPVVFAAKILGAKVFIHEQTSRVGLANKLCSLVADKVFYSFEESQKFFPEGKSYYSGYPLRREIEEKGASHPALKSLGHLKIEDRQKPLFFITGGGNGSLIMNQLIEKHLDELKKDYLIVHQVGDKFVKDYEKYHDENYLALGFIGEEMISLMREADIVLSRAGAGTVCELIALNKKSIYIPLKIAQKNEQYWNAMEAVKKCNSLIIEEDQIEQIDLVKTLKDFFKESDKRAQVIQLTSGREFLIKEINNSN